MECILGVNSKTDPSALALPKEGNQNQFINRQSMNARLIMVEKKMDQMGKVKTFHYKESSESELLSRKNNFKGTKWLEP